MHALNDFRRRVLPFPDAPPVSPETARWPGPVTIAVATAVIYTICNAPIDKVTALLDAHRWWSGRIAPPNVPLDEFVRFFIVPLKALLFAVALVCLLVPIIRGIARGVRTIDGATLRRSVKLSLILLAVCWALCWPYHRTFWAVGNWGMYFAWMSEDPFNEPHNYFHRRLLKPALAYFLQLHGPLLYWLFSMLCAAVLSFLIVLYFEVALVRRRDDGAARAIDRPDPLIRALAALGVMTTNVIMLHLAAPGYVDDMLAILVMLQILLPLTLRERLCLLALAMATHEAAAVFSLGPLVLVLFPNWRQRFAGWFVMGVFFVFWLASYGMNLPAAFGVHTQFEKTDTFQVFTTHPRMVAFGVFMAHKFFWLVFLAAILWLIARRQWIWAAVLAACTLTPLATMPIATDTSRLVGVGFAGILFSIVLLLPELRATGQRLFALVCLFSILVPYFPSGGAWIELPAGGYYKAFYMYVRGWF